MPEALPSRNKPVRPLSMVECRDNPARTEEGEMGKVLRCRDLGMSCTTELRAPTEEEILKLAAEHAEKDHGIHASSIPPGILAMVKAAIKDE